MQGSYSELTSVFVKLREWVEQEGYEMVNSPYEIYKTDPYQESADMDMITEVYFPVRKKSKSS
ncbi:hypothetical protein D3C80_1834870 [compost metagenome]